MVQSGIKHEKHSKDENKTTLVINTDNEKKWTGMKATNASTNNLHTSDEELNADENNGSIYETPLVNSRSPMSSSELLIPQETFSSTLFPKRSSFGLFISTDAARQKNTKSRNDRRKRSFVTNLRWKESSTAAFNCYWQIICVIAGTGILGLPSTIAQAGWIGIPCIVIVAILATYCGILLVQCLYPPSSSRKRLESYPEIATEAFGSPGRICVKCLHWGNLIGTSMLYIILSGTSLKDLFYPYIGGSEYIWIAISGLIVSVVVLSAKTLKEASILSFFGAFASFVVAFAIVFDSIWTMRINKTEIQHTNFVHWRQIPSALTAIAFSLGGINVYPHIESHISKMRNVQWHRILISAMSTMVALLYLPVAGVAYAAYGSQTKNPILFNLIPGSMANTANFLITLHVLLACPILLTSFFVETENEFGIHDTVILESRERYIQVSNVNYGSVQYRSDEEKLWSASHSALGSSSSPLKSKNPALSSTTTTFHQNLHDAPTLDVQQNTQELSSDSPLRPSPRSMFTYPLTPWKATIYRLSYRSFIMLLITVVATHLPYFDIFMRIIGGLSQSTLVLIFPPLLSWKLWGFKHRKNGGYIGLYLGIGSIMLGCISLIIGTSDALIDLYDTITTS